MIRGASCRSHTGALRTQYLLYLVIESVEGYLCLLWCGCAGGGYDLLSGIMRGELSVDCLVDALYDLPRYQPFRSQQVVPRLCTVRSSTTLAIQNSASSVTLGQ